MLGASKQKNYSPLFTQHLSSKSCKQDFVSQKKDDSIRLGGKPTEITEKHRKEFSVIRFPRCPFRLSGGLNSSIFTQNPPKAEWKGAGLLLFIFLVCALFFNCHKESSPFWWGKKDSTAVFEELTRWQDTFDLRSFFSPTRQFSIFSQLSSLDSISRSGDSLVKIYHLENSWDTLSSMNHSDSLAFHANADTFCDVRFEDFCLHTISVIEGDTIWVVKYRKNPPDTLWRLASAGKKIYPQGQFGKVYAWSGPRKIQLKKQADSYQLKRFGGLTIYVPARESAPQIQYVVLAKSSVSDTFYESDVSNNLISLDSLFIVEVGESLLVSVKSEDSDTEGNPYYFFIQSGSDKLNITYDARFGRGKIVFGQSGINHINIEVLPGKNLFYPSNNYYSTIWSIPIRVR